MNILNYVDKYKDKTFYEEPFNELDNLILSQLLYLGCEDKHIKNKMTLNDLGTFYLEKNDYKNIEFKAEKDAYKVLKKVINTKRYKDIQVYNYIYIGNDNTQFSAATFKLKKDLIYVAYEGTDNLLSGWKEDIKFSYKFPVEAEKLAIDYINNTIKLFDRKVIVGGHSKGGHLALIASMYSNIIVRSKIKMIYNNDGPGLRSEQMNSKRYNKIKNKYIHIVPDYSYVGILLNNDHYKVIKTSINFLNSHSILNWKVNDKSLIVTTRSKLSRNLELSMLSWLSNNDSTAVEKLNNIIFDSLDELNIKTVNELIKLKNMFKVKSKFKNLDIEMRILLKNFLKYNFKNIFNKNVIQDI